MPRSKMPKKKSATVKNTGKKSAKKSKPSGHRLNLSNPKMYLIASPSTEVSFVEERDGQVFVQTLPPEVILKACADALLNAMEQVVQELEAKKNPKPADAPGDCCGDCSTPCRGGHTAEKAPIIAKVPKFKKTDN